MVSDLQDLGTAVLFTLDPNWATLPHYNIQPMRRIIGFNGTANVLQSLGDVPIFSVNANYFLNGRTQKNYLLNFVHSHRGRLNRFWFKHPKSFFTLQEDIGLGATIMYVDRQEFDWIFQGYERFYIQMGNGDIITRKIDSIVDNNILNRLEISFLPAIDRDILIAANNTIGRLLLCRFDHDDFTYKITTQTYADISLRVIELIQEYDEV